MTAERNASSTVSSVLPALGNSGIPASGGAVATFNQPLSVYDGSGKTGTLFGLYVQDEWHVLPRKTINYGLRFD